MKRFFVSLALVLLVVWAARSHHARPVHQYGPGHHDVRTGRDFAWEGHPGVQTPQPTPWLAVPTAVSAREDAEGLPVPIVPGTRVTEAQAKPPAPPRGVIGVRHGQTPRAVPPRPPVAIPTILVKGQISATTDRADADARDALRDKAADWLQPEVPRTWTIPTHLLQSLIVDTQYTQDERPYGTLYLAELKVNLSSESRAAIVETYTRELIQHRLVSLGGALVFVLIGLGAISGYIRADEATKGYYTTRLRMLAAAGVGAAGVILYRMVA